MITNLRTGLSTRPSDQTLGIALIVISACSFGSGALFVQPLYERGMDPLAVLFWRFTTAALFSWGFLLMSSRSRASLRSLPRRRLTVLALLGVLFVGNSYAYIASLQEVPITLASIIAYLYPAIVAVLATRLVRRLQGRRAWVALGLSLVGVALAVGGIPEGTLPPLWAMALAFANPFIYAVWIVLQSRIAGDRPARTRALATAEITPASAPESMARITTGNTADSAPGSAAEIAAGNTAGVASDQRFVIPPGDAEAATDIPDPSPAAAIMTTATAAVYAVLVLVTGGSISPLAVPESVWFAILGLGLVATALAIATFYAGVRRIGGARASLISTIEPVYTILLAMILFGERLAPMQWAGGALVIGAVILAETGRAGGSTGRSSTGRSSADESPRVSADGAPA